MLLAPLLVLSLVALSCSGSSSRTEPDPPARLSAPAASSAPRPVLRLPRGPTVPLPSAVLRIVALDPLGDLCVLDPESGQARSRLPVGAVDVLASRADPASLLTVEPAANGAESPGRLGRYELREDTLTFRDALPFSAPDGRLIDAGDALVGLAVSEVFSLFRAVDSEGTGRAWNPVVTAASYPFGDALRVLTASVPLDGKISLSQALSGPLGVASTGDLDVPADSVAVFSGGASFGHVTAWKGRLRVRWPGKPLDGSEQAAPGEEVHEARWLGDAAGLAVLVGPQPALRLLHPQGNRLVPLGGLPLAAPSLVSHQLAHDPSRGRLWVAAGHALRAVSLAEGRVVAESDCGAESVAALTGTR